MIHSSFAATIKLATHYITYIPEQMLLGDNGLKTLEAELPHIMNTLIICKENEEWQKVLELFKALDFFLSAQGHWQERIQACNAAKVAAEKLNYQSDIYFILEKLGATYHQLRDFDRSIKYYQHAIELAKNDNNYAVARRIRDNLGYEEEDKDLETLLIQCQAALKRAQQNYQSSYEKGKAYNQDAIALGYWLHTIGTIYQQKQLYDEAFTYFHHALDIAIRCNDVYRTSIVLAAVGATYRETKQYDKAIEGIELGKDIALDNDFREDLVASLYAQLAAIYNEKKEYQKAIHNYHIAIEYPPYPDPFHYGGLADSYLSLGKLQEAKRYNIMRRDLRPFDALGANVQLGIIALLQGEQDKAQACFETALAIWEITSKRKIYTESGHLSNKVIALLCLGRTQEAKDTELEAIKHTKLEDFDLFYLDLLAQSPFPPSGLTELRQMIEEFRN